MIFFQNLALFWVKNANNFAKFFGENILKIITSVPGVLPQSYGVYVSCLWVVRSTPAGVDRGSF
jgi:hypothetical protein